MSAPASVSPSMLLCFPVRCCFIVLLPVLFAAIDSLFREGARSVRVGRGGSSSLSPHSQHQRQPLSTLASAAGLIKESAVLKGS